MNTSTVVILFIVMWILFSQLAQLGNANDGCCRTNTCGTSRFDRMTWWASLIISIYFTFYLLTKIGMVGFAFTPYGRAAAVLNIL